MKKTIFKGSGVALITPFNEDMSVNYDMLEKMVDFQIDNGTDAIITCATTGESPTLKKDEHMNIIECVVKRTNGRIPVIAGTGSNNTEHAIDASIKAEKLGVSGLLAVTPYYNKTSQQGLIAHYKAISDNVNTPIILYNVPSRTGVNILPDTYKELAKIENIVATKEANGDLSSVLKTLSICGDTLNMYSGNDDQILPIMSLGGLGVISVFANVCPRESHDLTHAILNEDYKTARKIQIKYADLMNALFCDVNPIPVKAALKMMGLDCGICRLPLIEMNAEKEKELKQIMINHKLI